MVLAASVAGCRPGAVPSPDAAARLADSLSAPLPLPTGRRLDPAGISRPVGALPLALLPAPGGQLVAVLSGWREQGIQVLAHDGTVRQTLVQPAAFIGAAFSPDSQSLYVSGGNQDQVYRYAWSAGRATLVDSLVLAVKATPKSDGTRYPAGIGVSPDGRFVYAAENLGDSLAVIAASTGKVVQRVPAGRYPYGVAVAPDGIVYVSAWGGHEVRAYAWHGDRLQLARTLDGGRHPSAVLLNRDGSRLFVASGSTDRVSVFDTRSGKLVTTLLDPPPSGPAEGSTPNGLALAADGTRLFVAEGDANAIAVFDLTAQTAGVPATGTDHLAGRIPAEWYPSAALAVGDTLFVANAKGRGTRANPDDGPGPRGSRERKGTNSTGYTLAQLSGTLTISTTARASGTELGALSGRVARANRWDQPPVARRGYPPIEHVIYVIKENRSYDQVLGDLPQADGDTSLVFFGRQDSPNHHALAERFGIYDRFFVNAEASPDGHNWSMAAYTTDYLQKTVPSNYSDRGRDYDYEGTNRGWGPGRVPEDDVNEPAMGYLWDLAQRKGVSFRNYGEFVVGEGMENMPLPAGYRGLKPFLVDHTCDSFPAYDLRVQDQRRVEVWLSEFRQFERTGTLPAFEIVRLPNDHTSGLSAGAPTPRAHMADNDLALGRMIEALSTSRYWKNTVVFVLEDDAQNGPDHVDSHRSPLLVISPWARAGVTHRFANTTDVIRTMEELLGLDALSQFDHFGRPLREIWRSTPDTAAYTALVPRTPLTDKNPAKGEGARISATLDLHIEDAADEDTFNRVLWLGLKGQARYPGPTRMPLLEGLRAR
jgi:YVTN family beta-propeller protein